MQRSLLKGTSTTAPDPRAELSLRTLHRVIRFSHSRALDTVHHWPSAHSPMATDLPPARCTLTKRPSGSLVNCTNTTGISGPLSLPSPCARAIMPPARKGRDAADLQRNVANSGRTGCGNTKRDPWGRSPTVCPYSSSSYTPWRKAFPSHWWSSRGSVPCEVVQMCQGR